MTGVERREDASYFLYNRHAEISQCQEEIAGRLRQLRNDDVRRSE